MKNLNGLGIFNIGKIQLDHLFEIHIIMTVDQIYGEIELIKAIIEKKKPEKVIFYNEKKN